MDKIFRHYWDDIRKTMVRYSLIPVLVLLLFGYPLLYASFLSILYKSNEQDNRQISQELEAALTQQIESVEYLAGDVNIQNTLEKNAGENEVASYRQIYEQLNRAVLKVDCFVADGDGNVILSTKASVPEYLESSYFSHDGIGIQMRQNPEEAVIQQYQIASQDTRRMHIGHTVIREGEILGYVILDLPEDEILQLLLRNTSKTSAITDKFGHLFAGSVSNSFFSHNKLLKPLRDGEKNVYVDGKRKYVSLTEILDGRVMVYTIMDMGYLQQIFLSIALLLFFVVVVFTLLLMITSQRFAKRKSKSLESMVSAIQNLETGDMNQSLPLESRDEFGYFATAYNHMLVELKKQMEVNEEIARQTAVAEMKQLESQFNPHFLYNTLSVVRYMVKFDPEAAQKMIGNVSAILRYSIGSDSSLVLLEKDLKYTENYMEIMQYRYGDNLKFLVNIAPETLECQIPKLVLQPVIENAIKYGFADTAAITVTVNAKISDGQLLLTIQNDGTGMDANRLQEVREALISTYNRSGSIGLHNVHRRIQLLCGEAYGIEINSEVETGTAVIIRLPVQRGGQCD